jgi:dTMP kinase
MARGLFITFEGIDGCGKSTQVEYAHRGLEKDGIAHIVTREPGGTPLAERIRGLLLSPENAEMTGTCEVLLYLASRAQHVAEKVVPALEQGMVVLCDRFAEATFAYQGYGRGFGLEALENLNEFATSGMRPDRTFIFDVSLEVSRARLLASGKPLDRLESNAADFHARVREGYRALAARDRERVEVLSGEDRPELVGQQVYRSISQLIVDRG